MSDSWMRILEHVAATSHPTSPTELEDKTRIPPATVTRSLASLVRSGYLRRLGRGKYVLGERMKELARSAWETKGRNFLFLQLFWASYDEIYQGVSEVLDRQGSHCLVHPLGSSLEDGKPVGVRLPAQCPGVFFYSRWKPWSLASQLVGLSEIPAVHIGYAGYDSCDTVSWDERDGYARLARGLVEQGCRSLIYLGNRRLHGWGHSARFRRFGYRDAVFSEGIEDEQLLVGEDAGATLRTCKTLSRRIERTQGPLGVVCDYFELLPGLVAGLEASGTLHPQKLRIAASYTRENRRNFGETLGRLALGLPEPWQAVGRAAGQRLLQRLAGKCSQTELVLVPGRIVPDPAGGSDGQE